eukprot:g46509.t1
MFKSSVENLDKYATTIMDFISKCMEYQRSQVFPNHKPWMNQQVHSLLKTRCAAFNLGDPGQYRKSRSDIHKAIREAKRQYHTKLEAQTYQTDSHCLWQGINNTTGCKMKQCKIVDRLNAFYARFEQNTTGMALPGPTAPDTAVPSVSASEVRSVFLGVNPKETHPPNLHISEHYGQFSTANPSSLHIFGLVINFRKKGGEHAPIYING